MSDPFRIQWKGHGEIKITSEQKQQLHAITEALWYSEDTDIASVDDTGVVTAHQTETVMKQKDLYDTAAASRTIFEAAYANASSRCECT